VLGRLKGSWKNTAYLAFQTLYAPRQTMQILQVGDGYDTFEISFDYDNLGGSPTTAITYPPMKEHAQEELAAFLVPKMYAAHPPR